MKKSILLNGIFALLAFGTSICMFVQAKNDGGLSYFSNGVAFEAKDLALLFIHLLLSLIPLIIAAMIDAKKGTHLFKWAWILSAVIFFCFPPSYEGRLWSDASFPDGKPMFDDYTKERVKSWDAFYGFSPVWKESGAIDPDYTRYETTDLGERRTFTGNRLWNSINIYTLNSTDTIDPTTGESPALGYECLSETSKYFLGFYWRDLSGDYLEYVPTAKLPKDLCKQIKRPKIGSEIK